MPRMLPGIDTLAQHQEQLQNDPDAYRPERCPQCGKAGLHHHGHYERNPPRGEGLALSLGPLRILRFCCPSCGRTCSRLPACLSPWRHYWWQTQQAVFERLLAGASTHSVADHESPSRRTVGRWWRRLEARFERHAMHLRGRFPDLGRAPGWRGFWSLCLAQMRLSVAMGWLDQGGESVP